MSQVVAGAWLASCLGAVLLVPGAVALRLAGYRARGLEWLALAPGVSVALWPVIVLWSTLFGVAWSSVLALAFMGILSAFLIGSLVWQAKSKPVTAADAGMRRSILALAAPHRLLLLAVVALALATRVWQVRGVWFPPWVDGYHHTIVTQLMLDQGGVPAGYEPFMPIERFFYHFGFHAVASMTVWLSGATAANAVLWSGQALSVATVLSTYILAKRLVRHPAAATVAAAVPATLYYFPAYYTTWGRYTQLAGLVVFPAAWVVLWDAARPRGSHRLAVCAGLAAGGLLLTHYRMFAFYLLGAAVLAVGAVWQRRSSGRSARLIAVAAISGFAAALPWIASRMLPGLAAMAGTSAAWYRAPAAVNDVPDWVFSAGTLASNRLWIVLATVGLGLGLFYRRRAAVALAAGVLAALLAVSPSLLGLPPTYFLPPFVLAIAAYIPVALGLAMLADTASDAVAHLVLRVGWRAAGHEATRSAAEHAEGCTEGRAAAATAATGADAAAATAAATGANTGAATEANARADIAADRGPVARHTELAGLAVGATALVAALAAAPRVPGINPVTVIAQQADQQAALWIREHTPVEACFLVNATHWHLGTYRGADGGYWLPLSAQRATTMPPALYNYGSAEYATEVRELAESMSRANRMSDEELSALMNRTGADYVYVGPASAEVGGSLRAERLAQHPELEEVYANGGAHVFHRARRPTGVSASGGNGACRPAARAQGPGAVPAQGPRPSGR